jgi:hypothetical protein
MLKVDKMNRVSPWKIGFVDLGAILFVIGGVVSLITTVLTIPIASIYDSCHRCSTDGTLIYPTPMTN